MKDSNFTGKVIQNNQQIKLFYGNEQFNKVMAKTPDLDLKTLSWEGIKTHFKDVSIENGLLESELQTHKTLKIKQNSIVDHEERTKNSLLNQQEIDDAREKGEKRKMKAHEEIVKNNDIYDELKEIKYQPFCTILFEVIILCSFQFLQMQNSRIKYAHQMYNASSKLMYNAWNNTDWTFIEYEKIESLQASVEYSKSIMTYWIGPDLSPTRDYPGLPATFKYTQRRVEDLNFQANYNLVQAIIFNLTVYDTETKAPITDEWVDFNFTNKRSTVYYTKVIMENLDHILNNYDETNKEYYLKQKVYFENVNFIYATEYDISFTKTFEDGFKKLFTRTGFQLPQPIESDSMKLGQISMIYGLSIYIIYTNIFVLNDFYYESAVTKNWSKFFFNLVWDIYFLGYNQYFIYLANKHPYLEKFIDIDIQKYEIIRNEAIWFYEVSVPNIIGIMMKISENMIFLFNFRFTILIFTCRKHYMRFYVAFIVLSWLFLAFVSYKAIAFVDTDFRNQNISYSFRQSLLWTWFGDQYDRHLDRFESIKLKMLFQQIIEAISIHYFIFSLYGLLSETVMEVIREFEKPIEIYSLCYNEIKNKQAEALQNMVTFENTHEDKVTIVDSFTQGYQQIKSMEQEFRNISKDNLTDHLIKMTMKYKRSIRDRDKKIATYLKDESYKEQAEEKTDQLNKKGKTQGSKENINTKDSILNADFHKGKKVKKTKKNKSKFEIFFINVYEDIKFMRRTKLMYVCMIVFLMIMVVSAQYVGHGRMDWEVSKALEQHLKWIQYIKGYTNFNNLYGIGLQSTYYNGAILKSNYNDQYKFGNHFPLTKADGVMNIRKSNMRFSAYHNNMNDQTGIILFRRGSEMVNVTDSDPNQLFAAYSGIFTNVTYTEASDPAEYFFGQTAYTMYPNCYPNLNYDATDYSSTVTNKFSQQCQNYTQTSFSTSNSRFRPDFTGGLETKLFFKDFLQNTDVSNANYNVAFVNYDVNYFSLITVIWVTEFGGAVIKDEIASSINIEKFESKVFYVIYYFVALVIFTLEIVTVLSGILLHLYILYANITENRPSLASFMIKYTYKKENEQEKLNLDKKNALFELRKSIGNRYSKLLEYKREFFKNYEKKVDQSIQQMLNETEFLYKQIKSAGIKKDTRKDFSSTELLPQTTPNKRYSCLCKKNSRFQSYQIDKNKVTKSIQNIRNCFKVYNDGITHLEKIIKESIVSDNGYSNAQSFMLEYGLKKTEVDQFFENFLAWPSSFFVYDLKFKNSKQEEFEEIVKNYYDLVKLNNKQNVDNIPQIVEIKLRLKKLMKTFIKGIDDKQRSSAFQEIRKQPEEKVLNTKIEDVKNRFLAILSFNFNYFDGMISRVGDNKTKNHILEKNSDYNHFLQRSEDMREPINLNQVIDQLSSNLIFYIKNKGLVIILRLYVILFMLSAFYEAGKFLETIKIFDCYYEDCKHDIFDLFLEKVEFENVSKVQAAQSKQNTHYKELMNNFNKGIFIFQAYKSAPQLNYEKKFRELIVAIKLSVNILMFVMVLFLTFFFCQALLFYYFMGPTKKEFSTISRAVSQTFLVDVDFDLIQQKSIGYFSFLFMYYLNNLFILVICPSLVFTSLQSSSVKICKIQEDFQNISGKKDEEQRVYEILENQFNILEKTKVAIKSNSNNLYDYLTKKFPKRISDKKNISKKINSFTKKSFHNPNAIPGLLRKFSIKEIYKEEDRKAQLNYWASLNSKKGKKSELEKLNLNTQSIIDIAIKGNGDKDKKNKDLTTMDKFSFALKQKKKEQYVDAMKIQKSKFYKSFQNDTYGNSNSDDFWSVGSTLFNTLIVKNNNNTTLKDKNDLRKTVLNHDQDFLFNMAKALNIDYDKSSSLESQSIEIKKQLVKEIWKAYSHQMVHYRDIKKGLIRKSSNLKQNIQIQLNNGFSISEFLTGCAKNAFDPVTNTKIADLSRLDFAYFETKDIYLFEKELKSIIKEQANENPDKWNMFLKQIYKNNTDYNKKALESFLYQIFIRNKSVISKTNDKNEQYFDVCVNQIKLAIYIAIKTQDYKSQTFSTQSHSYNNIIFLYHNLFEKNIMNVCDECQYRNPKHNQSTKLNNTQKDMQNEDSSEIYCPKHRKIHKEIQEHREKQKKFSRKITKDVLVKKLKENRTLMNTIGYWWSERDYKLRHKLWICQTLKNDMPAKFQILFSMKYKYLNAFEIKNKKERKYIGQDKSNLERKTTKSFNSYKELFHKKNEQVNLLKAVSKLKDEKDKLISEEKELPLSTRFRNETISE